MNQKMNDAIARANKIIEGKKATVEELEKKIEETEKTIKGLKERLKTPEVVSDYDLFKGIKGDLETAQQYWAALNSLRQAELAPVKEEQILFDSVMKDFEEAIKEIGAEAEKNLRKESKKVLELIEAADSEQKRGNDTIIELTNVLHFGKNPYSIFPGKNILFRKDIRDIYQGFKALTQK